MLAGSLVVALSGCQTGLPKAPDIDLYVHSAASGKALCTDTGTGAGCPSVRMADTDRWYMLTPAGFEALQNYIDALIRAIESKAVNFEGGEAAIFFAANSYEEGLSDVLASRAQLAISLAELRKASAHLRWLRRVANKS